MDEDELLYREMDTEDPFYMGDEDNNSWECSEQTQPVNAVCKPITAKQKGMLIGFCIGVPIFTVIFLLLYYYS